MAFLEDQDNLSLAAAFNTSYAMDYNFRYPTFVWKKLWMILREDNIPINSTGSLTSFDISNVWSENYRSYLTDHEFVYWSWTSFTWLVDVAVKAWKFYSVVDNQFVYSNPN